MEVYGLARRSRERTVWRLGKAFKELLLGDWATQPTCAGYALDNALETRWICAGYAPETRWIMYLVGLPGLSCLAAWDVLAGGIGWRFAAAFTAADFPLAGEVGWSGGPGLEQAAHTLSYFM